METPAPTTVLLCHSPGGRGEGGTRGVTYLPRRAAPLATALQGSSDSSALALAITDTNAVFLGETVVGSVC